MKKALFTQFKLSKAQEDKLKKSKVKIEYARGDLNEDELVERLQDCQIYIIGGADRATKKVIESTQLELIIFWGTGWESYIDIKSADTKKVKVANTPHSNAYTVAEHSVALTLDAVKQITYLNNTTRKGEWNRRKTWTLEDKTLGIIGMGHIGSSVARIMHDGFKMNVIYYSRSRKLELEKEILAKKVDLPTLMTQSDIVSIHTPLTEETKNLIGKKEIGLMKKHAVLINCTRADLVDYKALKYALKNNKIACAAFDAYYQEPAPKKDMDKWGLLNLPEEKFILTPHTGYGSQEAVDLTNEMVVENISSFLKLGVPKYKVG